MTSLSSGLKAGLAAGVIYGAFIGVLHAGVLEACRGTQMMFIARNLISQPLRLKEISFFSAQTATDVFQNDLIHFPIYWGIGGLVLGVVYGAAFAATYRRLPGSSSKQKGMALGVAVFFLGLLLGLSGLEIACGQSLVPELSVVMSLPISITFGYILGMFFDSFGTLSKEQREDKIAHDHQQTDAKRNQNVARSTEGSSEFEITTMVL